VSPEAAVGGPIALINDGDIITIDAVKNTISCNVSDAQMNKRRQQWQAPAPKSTRGVLAKYARTVSSASLGAVTDG
jgi:dihydroxy-acid dehydratase